MVASDMPVSTMAVKRAAISATRKANKTRRQTPLTDAKDAIDALLRSRRKKRHARSAEEIENDKVKSKTAKAHMQQRNGD